MLIKLLTAASPAGFLPAVAYMLRFDEKLAESSWISDIFGKTFAIFPSNFFFNSYSVCSVIKNWDNKVYEILGVQRDRYTPNKERTGYDYSPDINATVWYLKSETVETENGQRKVYRPVMWNKKTKRWNKGGTKITLGRREYYKDPSF